MDSLTKAAVRGVKVLTTGVALVVAAHAGAVPRTPADDAGIKLATDIFKQLIEINTSHSVGSTTVAADAMAKRLRDAGFPESDVVVMGPDPRRGNMVERVSTSLCCSSALSMSWKPSAAIGRPIPSSSSRRTGTTMVAGRRI